MPSRAVILSQVRQRAGLEVLAWPVFDPLPVDVLATTRHGGVSAGRYATLNLSFSVGDEPARVVENRRRAAAALGADLADFVFARQVHSSHAEIVTAADRGRGALTPGDPIPDTDALVTADPGTALAVLAADCVPIALYDPDAHVLGCVHAGWRGTAGRAAEAAVAAMRSLGAQASRMIAALGPAIAPSRYEVSQDVATAFSASFGDEAGQVLRPAPDGRWLCDLWAANRVVLVQAGVPEQQVHLPGVATGTDPGLFFSHRAEQPSGRFALMARLRERSER